MRSTGWDRRTPTRPSLSNLVPATGRSAAQPERNRRVRQVSTMLRLLGNYARLQGPRVHGSASQRHHPQKGSAAPDAPRPKAP